MFDVIAHTTMTQGTFPWKRRSAFSYSAETKILGVNLPLLSKCRLGPMDLAGPMVGPALGSAAFHY